MYFSILLLCYVVLSLQLSRYSLNQPINRALFQAAQGRTRSNSTIGTTGGNEWQNNKVVGSYTSSGAVADRRRMALSRWSMIGYWSALVQTSALSLYFPSHAAFDKNDKTSRSFAFPRRSAGGPTQPQSCDVAGWLDNIDRRTTQTPISTRLQRRLSTTAI